MRTTCNVSSESNQRLVFRGIPLIVDFKQFFSIFCGEFFLCFESETISLSFLKSAIRQSNSNLIVDKTHSYARHIGLSMGLGSHEAALTLQ